MTKFVKNAIDTMQDFTNKKTQNNNSKIIIIIIIIIVAVVLILINEIEEGRSDIYNND